MFALSSLIWRLALLHGEPQSFRGAGIEGLMGIEQGFVTLLELMMQRGRLAEPLITAWRC